MAVIIAGVPRENEIEVGGIVSNRWFDWFNALRGVLLLLRTHVHLVNADPNGSEYGMAGDVALWLGGAPGSTLFTKESGTAALPTNSDWRAV